MDGTKTQTLVRQLLLNALHSDRAGQPLVALGLVDEALMTHPGHPLAMAMKRRIERRFFCLMEAYRFKRIAIAVAEALRCEREGAPERARALAIQVLSTEEDHSEALQILERADAVLARDQRCC